MSKLTESARGKDCTIRLPGGCLSGGETTVAAHYRLAGTCGMGIKPPDTNAARACDYCHGVVDGRIKTDLDPEFIRLAHAEGVLRTLAQLAAEGWQMRKAA